VSLLNTELIEINTDQMSPPKVGAALFENRTAVTEMQQTAATAEVSVIVQAYNQPEKTRRCVESVLKYTQDVDYELILLDNGSAPGITEFFCSVPYNRKKVIRFTKNLGTSFPCSALKLNDLGRFICFLACDIIVTTGWLKNLLTCMYSDNRIGMVNPVCSNTSNLQNVELEYADYAAMQDKARQFNQSDPNKWEDRLRLITLGTLYRKEALMATGWPIYDIGFFHDFGDDDITFRIRRMGYRTVLAGDTWVCHDHDLRHGEGKDPVEFQRSLEIGRANFREKYFGVDAWDDVNNYYIPFVSSFPLPQVTGQPQILGVDVRCGTPILDLKNWLRKSGLLGADLSAFTQDPKYWIDLKTICAGPVICDREEFLIDSFPQGFFDYVIADQPLNRYHEPIKMLRDMFSLCKEGGYLVCKLTNAYSFREYLHLLGQTDVYNPTFSLNIPLEPFRSALQQWGEIVREIRLGSGLNTEGQTLLASLYPDGLPEEQRTAALERMQCQEFLFVVRIRTGQGILRKTT